jgi:hypothetical protein
MRRRSLKRAAMDRKASESRDGLREMVGRCEWCGRHNFGLEVHEILRGGYRAKTQDQPCCQLVLCRDCHDLMGGRDWAEQLAILMRSRPEDFNLLKFHDLASRRKPLYEEVELWSMRLSFVLAAYMKGQ